MFHMIDNTLLTFFEYCDSSAEFLQHPMTGIEKTAAEILQSLGCIYLLGAVGITMVLFIIMRYTMTVT